jgi:hypothetical protein
MKMNNVQDTQSAERQAVVMDERLDVRHRLAQLREWKQAWEHEDQLLAQRVMQLKGTGYLDIQKGSQIASLRRRLRLNMVREPIEIAPDLVEEVSYPVLRRHLVQQFAGLTNEERLLWLNNFLFILTPDLRRLNDKIETVRRYRSFGQQRNFLLGGESGMGKTTYLNWLTANLIPTLEVDHNRVPIVKIDAPESSKYTPKPVFQRMILECGMHYLCSDNEEELLLKLALCFQKCQVELLVVDEVEHLTRREVRRRLLEVSNLIPDMPIICASCHPYKWVAGDLEIAGRWNDYFELRQYTGERLNQLLAFIELLLPFPQPSSLALPAFEVGQKKRNRRDGPARLIEKWTGGILRDIMILILDASTRAIKQGLPKLSPGLLAATWQEIQTRQVTDFLQVSQRNGGG